MTTAATVSVRLDLISKQFEQGLNDAKGKAQDFSKSIEAAGKTMRNAGAALTAGFTVPMVAMGIKSAMAAGRVDELDLVVRTLGVNAGYTESEIDGYVKSVQKMGIEAGASREVIAKFVTAQLNAADASKIARIAQDQAVITGENSTETTMRMTDAIIKGSQESFRAMMMNVNLSDSYEVMAKELGKTVDELTEAEKVQARVNAVIEYGATVTGTYEASMESGTKQLRSYKRYIDDIFVAVGQNLTPALNDVVFAGKDMLKWIKDAVSEGGSLEPILKMVASSLSDVAGFIADVVDWFTKAPPWISKVAATFGLFLAVLGPILLTGGQFLIMLPKLTSGLAAAQGAMATLGVTTTITTGGLILVAAAVAALIVGLMKLNAVAKEKNAIMVKDIQQNVKGVSSYNEYATALTNAAHEQGLLIDSNGNLINKNGNVIASNYLLSESTWELERAFEKYGDTVELTTEDLNDYWEFVDGEWIPVQIRSKEVTDDANEALSKYAGVVDAARDALQNMNIESEEQARLLEELALVTGDLTEADVALKDITGDITQAWVDGKLTAPEYAEALVMVKDLLNEGSIAAGGYANELNSIPTEIRTDILRFIWDDIHAGPYRPSHGWSALDDERLQIRALGGPVQSGTPYIVGEQGPELFVPNQSGQIIPNDELGTGQQFTIYMNAKEDPALTPTQAIKWLTMLYGAN